MRERDTITCAGVSQFIDAAANSQPVTGQLYESAISQWISPLRRNDLNPKPCYDTNRESSSAATPERSPSGNLQPEELLICTAVILFY